MDYTSRLRSLREAFKALQCHAAIVSDLINVRYLTGFSGTSGMVIVTENAAFFLTDFRYEQQASEQVPSEYSITIAQQNLWSEAANLLNDKARKIGFEAEHTSYALWQENKRKFSYAELLPTTNLVEALRLCKDEGELAIMRRAIAIADEAMEAVFKVLRPGLTEQEVADELLHQIKARGASGPSFDFIVASGPRGALPHGVASEKTLQAGEMVTIDMGAVYNGYCSDLTRTVCLGKPTAEQQKIYGIVWQAQTAAAEQMRAGLSCQSADQVARDIITEAGYGKYFGHGLGHGVGMEIHEAPRVSSLGSGKLQAGSVVSCEPGIYIPEWGGVRIEDLLLIEESGAQILSQSPKPQKILEL